MEPDLQLENEQMGPTEYCLIGLWAVFTAGIFALLYRITQEADEENEKNKNRKKRLSQIKEENGQ